MTVTELMYLCDFMALVPKKYDAPAWTQVVGKFMSIGVDCSNLLTDMEQFPKNRDAISSMVKEYRESIIRDNASKSLAVSINADAFVGLPEDKKEKQFKAYLEYCEMTYFPAYIVELNPVRKEFLIENFMFTYSNDGKRVVYMRKLDKPGTIWEEAPDSEAPFSKLQGSLRNSLATIIATTFPMTTVTVIVMKDGKPKMHENIPYYALYTRFENEIMSGVSGTPNNREYFHNILKQHVKELESEFKSKKTKAQLSLGMVKVVEELTNMDENLDQYGFIYQEHVKIPSLTNDPKEPAFAYFDLNTITPGPTPDFDGFMLSIEPACRDALMAAIFATFFAQSHLNQYIWIHGEGGDGKSSLLNAIAEYAGDNLACSLGQTMNSDFGLENAIGKRMVILSDVKTGLSVKSQLIHNLTGHDPVSVNRKNKPIITVRLDPIVWIAANAAPDVNFDNRNEARRCLYIKMQEPPVEIKRKFYFTDENGNFIKDANGQPINNGYDLQGNLVKEMPHILYKCKEAFMRVCPAPYSVIKPTIEQSSLALENCIDLDANEWATYIEESFDFTNKDARLKITEIHEHLQETRIVHGEKGALSTFARRDIIRLLTVKYGCSKKKIHGVRYLEGIALANTPIISWVKSANLQCTSAPAEMMQNLYDDYKEWCHEAGIFAKPRDLWLNALRNMFPGLTTTIENKRELINLEYCPSFNTFNPVSKVV